MDLFFWAFSFSFTLHSWQSKLSSKLQNVVEDQPLELLLWSFQALVSPTLNINTPGRHYSIKVHWHIYALWTPQTIRSVSGFGWLAHHRQIYSSQIIFSLSQKQSLNFPKAAGHLRDLRSAEQALLGVQRSWLKNRGDRAFGITAPPPDTFNTRV